jgi:DNA-binding winged helix-turn-helix (wHTH) protein
LSGFRSFFEDFGRITVSGAVFGTIWSSGPFVLNVATAELTRDGVQVNIEPQSLRLLEYLIQRRERVVSRADFVDAIRQGRAI